MPYITASPQARTKRWLEESPKPPSKGISWLRKPWRITGQLRGLGNVTPDLIHWGSIGMMAFGAYFLIKLMLGR